MENAIVEVKKKVRLNRKLLFILYFFVFAFLGWVLETLFSFYALGHFTNRGFLYGPICPIYGYGAIILILFLARYQKNSVKLFFYSAIIFSIFEYFVSFALEALFGIHWWDYTNEFMNLNGRISIFYAFAWGIIAILFINHIYPFMKRKINTLLSKIPYILQLLILCALIIAFIVDTVLSCIHYFHLSILPE